MASLILSYDIESNKLRGRCDARCHLAKNQKCRCICGGKNHSKGLQQASENLKEIAAETAATNHRVTNEQGHKLQLKFRMVQQTLF